MLLIARMVYCGICKSVLEISLERGNRKASFEQLEKLKEA